MVSSSCCTCGTHHVNLVTNPVIGLEWGEFQEVFMTNGTYPWSLVTQIYHSGQSSHGGDRKTFEVMTWPTWTFGSVSSCLAAILHQGHSNRNHKPWNIVSTDRYYTICSQLRGCMSRYEAELSVSVVSFISSSMGSMRSTKSPSLELCSERTSSIERNVEFKNGSSFFSYEICLVRINEQ